MFHFDVVLSDLITTQDRLELVWEVHRKTIAMTKRNFTTTIRKRARKPLPVDLKFPGRPMQSIHTHQAIQDFLKIKLFYDFRNVVIITSKKRRT